MPRITVSVAHKRTLTTQLQRVPSIGENLQPFTGNDDSEDNDFRFIYPYIGYLPKEHAPINRNIRLLIEH